MRDDPAQDTGLPDWLTGATPEDERARQLLEQTPLPATQGAPSPGPNDDLAWLDEFIKDGVTPGSAPPQALTQNRQPRVTRVSSPANQPGAVPPGAVPPGAAPSTPTIATPPPAPAPQNHLLGRFNFQSLPAWWNAQAQRRSAAKRDRPSGALPAWLRE